MPNNEGYHKLVICQKLRKLIKNIYNITEKFPKSEMYGLTSQIRRSTISVLLNIVEGQRRQTKKEFLHFLDTADASLVETEACLELALDLQYLSIEDYNQIENDRKEIAYMLVALIKSINKL